MSFKDMTLEMIEMAKGRETAEERLSFAAENGFELADEQLEGVSGGTEHTACEKCPANPKKPRDFHEWEATGCVPPSPALFAVVSS